MNYTTNQEMQKLGASIKTIKWCQAAQEYIKETKKADRANIVSADNFCKKIILIILQ